MASLSQCARHGCKENSTSRCSSCLREPYCSSNCQKADWKMHKTMCKTLKKLSNDLVPFKIADQTWREIIAAGVEIEGNHIRIFKHLLSYTEFQFGERVKGKAYRERGNGERIDNYQVELELLGPLYLDIVTNYDGDESLSTLGKINMSFPYLKKLHEMLRPWILLVDSNDAILSIDQVNEILVLSVNTDRDMANRYAHRNECHLAEGHLKSALSHSKRYTGRSMFRTESGELTMKTYLLSTAFILSSNVRMMQNNFTEASVFAEENYNCLAEAHNPVHPDVLAAAGTLIECLIQKNDTHHLNKAELFAQVSLDFLRDPANGVDKNSDLMALGCYNFAKVLNNQFAENQGEVGKLGKAEMLARESYRIRTHLYPNYHRLLGISAHLLATVLKSQEKLGEETKKLFELSLAIAKRNEGSDGSNVGIISADLGHMYVRCAQNKLLSADVRKGHYLQAKSYYNDAVRIMTQKYGPNNGHTISYKSQLTQVVQCLTFFK